MTRTIIRPGLSPEQSANSFEDVELVGMSYGNSPQSNAYRELLAFRQGAEQATAMAELLRESKLCVELAWDFLERDPEWEAGAESLAIRIDAALAGKVPGHVADVSKMVVPESYTFSDRQLKVLHYALWMIINDAHMRATAAAQGRLGRPTKPGDVQSFLDDAKDAEELRAMLAAAPKPEGGAA